MPTWTDRPTMKLTYQAIILFASLLFGTPAIASGMAASVLWQALTPQEQQILTPLSNDWSTLSKKQQNSYIAIAKRYPQLTPLQQQRLQERMVRWAKMTPAQRHEAREKYRSVKQLPPEKREVEIRALREKHAKKHPEAASAVLPASAVQPGPKP